MKRFSTLDGLRGVAALAVAQFHAFALFGVRPVSSYLAVDLFFMLSGFVLAHAYEERIKEGLSVRRFMLARIIRLYPLYAAGTLAGAAFFVANTVLGNVDHSLSAVMFSLLLAAIFLPTPPGVFAGNSDLFPFMYPAWSLFFELVANLLYAAILPMLTTRALISLVAIGAAAEIWSGVQFGGLESGYAWGNFSGGFGRVVYPFFVGVLIFRLRLRWRGGTLHALLCTALLIAIFAAPVPEHARLAFDLTVVLLVFPVLTLAAAASEGGEWTRQSFAFLGNASYALYTLHAPLFWWAMGASSILFGVQLAEMAPVSGLLFLVAVTLLAYAFDRYYDRPIRRFLTGQEGSKPHAGKANCGVAA